jgi:hypothetical protein
MSGGAALADIAVRVKSIQVGVVENGTWKARPPKSNDGDRFSVSNDTPTSPLLQKTAEVK